jgi:voltage-gated potassium channel
VQARDPQRDDAGAGTRPGWTMITFGLLRSGAISVFLVALYYLLPLSHGSVSFLATALILGLTALAATAIWEVRAIVRSRAPAIRAMQALATLVPFFILLFASTYFILSNQAPATFSEPLSRSDALYFTITTFATVGFGDIAPRSEAVRLLVAGQVLLDLIILGLGIRVIFGAVKKGRTG